MTRPEWLDAQTKQADELALTGGVENPKAGQLVMVFREPPRFQKSLYLQKDVIDAYENLVLQQKIVRGKKGTELAEEAIRDLIKKYDR